MFTVECFERFASSTLLFWQVVVYEPGVLLVLFVSLCELLLGLGKLFETVRSIWRVLEVQITVVL